MSTAKRRFKRRGERGFALLFVFAMASAVAVMLYLEMPRWAVQSQRGKEQLLVDRGEQYKRAIQIFVRTVKKYPQTIDELEKFQDKRFLRRKYKDPFTGKDEWRLVHIDASGVFTDSKIHKPPQANDKEQPRQTFVGELPSIGNPNAGTGAEGEGSNPALKQRASDRPPVASGTGEGGQAAVDPNAPPPDPNAPPGAANPAGTPPIPGQPGAPPVIPGIPGMIPAQPGQMPGQVPGQGQPQTAPGMSQQQPQTSAPSFIGGGGVANSQTGGTSFIGGGTSAPPSSPQQSAPGRPGAPGAQFPTGVTAGGAGQVPQSAADMIRRMLTTPRPGGQPGVPQGAQQGGLGAGIAGVASKHEGEGIKIYNERTKYEEWEFLYNQQEEALQQLGAQGQQQGGGLQGQQGQGQGQRPQQQGVGFGPPPPPNTPLR